MIATPHTIRYGEEANGKYHDFMGQFDEKPPKVSPEDNFGLPTRILNQLAMTCHWGCDLNDKPYSLVRESIFYNGPRNPQYGYRIEQAPAITTQVINFKELLLTEGYEAAVKFALQQNKEAWADLMEGSGLAQLSGAGRAAGALEAHSQTTSAASAIQADLTAGK
jgi:hypothetical protein